MPAYAETMPNQSTSAQWPLRFKRHAFDAFCYNTQRCSVLYNGMNVTAMDVDQPSAAPPSTNYRERWPRASVLGIQNFPPPAQVRWTALDGTQHQAQVDIAALFGDELVRHHVSRDDYAEGSFGGSVDIVLEVNDHTLSVFTRAFLATKQEQIPGNPRSHFRNDLIEVWHQDY